MSKVMIWAVISAHVLMAQTRPRARDLHVPFDGTPGPHNAITDVSGVEVGHTTLISGDGALKVGSGPVRTGVTALLPRGKNDSVPVYASTFAQNGNGEMTGTAWIEEGGFAEGPMLLTNTHSVGLVRDATIKWQLHRSPHVIEPQEWSLPIVAETWDG
jgi:D-aminopeptidase